jgi:hypothetical protein
MKHLTYLALIVVTVLLTGNLAYAGLPLNNLEGVGGVAFNPLAYLANAGSKWKKEVPASEKTGKEKKDEK